MPAGLVLKGINTSGSSSPETFSFGQSFTSGIWKLSVTVVTGNSNTNLYQGLGVFPVYGNFTFAGYASLVRGRVPVFSTGINGTGYARYISFDEEIVLFAPSTSSPKLTLYPNSVILPGSTDYALGVLIREF